MDETTAAATPQDQMRAEPVPTGREAESYRAVEIERLETGVYVARNERGGELRFGSDSGADFTPVELLLVALAGCSAVDVDHMTARRALPTEFRVQAEGHKVREEGGTIMRDLALTFHVRFPEGPEGDAARDVLPTAVQVSHDRACTVSRTVEAGVPVAVRID